MKTTTQFLFPIILLFGACAAPNDGPYDPARPAGGSTDVSVATDPSDLDGDSTTTGSDTTDATSTTDSDHKGTPTVPPDSEWEDPEKDTDDDNQTGVDSGEQNPPELDTSSPEDGFSCDIPGGLLEPQDGESGYVIFDFGGVINDTNSNNPRPGEGNFSVKLRGKVVPFEVESMTSYYSYSMPGVVIKGYSVPQQTAGKIIYLEAKIATADLMEMNAYGEEHVDLFEVPTGNTSPTNVRIYEGRRSVHGVIEQLCLSAVAGTTGDPELTGLWPLWLCNTSIDWTNNVGESFGMAGNIALFDDAQALEDATGMRCVCPNGAGGWRNCDVGTPEAYGLLKFNFKYGASAGDWWTGYIYDEKTLNDRDGLDHTYGQQHPEGIWQRYWSPILGGLNIGAQGIDPTDGHTIYQFGQLMTPQNSATVIGLVSKDSKNDRFVVRQHAFDADDPSGRTTAGYWINAYLPGNITPGKTVSFGTGKNKGKLFVYDPDDSSCIMAVACRGEVRVQTTSKNLSAKEGGKLHLKTEIDGFDTRQSVQLWHPSELPADCNWATYLAESLQPPKIAVCDKI